MMLFKRLLGLTIIVIYLVILAGGIVRSTGSGMGCPDWPRCFGRWIPPTEITQLPPNYESIYGTKLKGEVVFNVYKTWTEYINRLLGVLAGLFVLATLIASVPFLKTDKVVFYTCLLGFLLMGFQGWLGSRVVAAELAPWIVTVHMIVAILITFVLLWVWVRTTSSTLSNENMNNLPFFGRSLGIILLLSLFQIILGTQVREVMDEVIKRVGEGARESWIENLDIKFYIHRSFSLLIFGLQLWFWWSIKKMNQNLYVQKMLNWVIVVISAEILTGAVMAYFAVPAFAQPVHLTLAVVMLGVQYVILLNIYPNLVWKQLRI